MAAMIELVIPDMSCGHCVQVVTQAVRGVDPAAQVEVDLAARRVRIQSASAVPAIAAALAEEGYPPRLDGAADAAGG